MKALFTPKLKVERHNSYQNIRKLLQTVKFISLNLLTIPIIQHFQKIHPLQTFCPHIPKPPFDVIY